MSVILKLDGVVAGYGAGDILKGVDLQVEEGTITCLIGPNGAGKSTVLKTVSGLLHPRRGTVHFGGTEISRLTPKARVLLGIVHVPQERSLFPGMTVADNLLMGGYLIKDAKVVRANLTMRLSGNVVSISRDDTMGSGVGKAGCEYTGTIKGNTVSGDYNCAWSRSAGKWKATISP